MSDGTGSVGYVALGDSISIDDYAGGPGRGGASLLAANRDDDFPQWSGADLGGMRWRLLATDGATTSTLLDRQLPQLERLSWRPSIVTLTIGGNDLLGCYGDSAAAHATVTTVADRVGEALGRLTDLVEPSGTVVLGTVYDPSDGTGDAGRVGLPPWPDVVQLIGELNDTVRELAAAHGAAVADIHAQFLGHGLAVGNPASSDPRPADRRLWYCNIIEPNAWGASGVRAAFWEALGRTAPV